MTPSIDDITESPLEAVKPRLRGWLHAGVTPFVLAAGIVLICLAPDDLSGAAAAVYAASGLLLFGTSAIYHRGTWSPRTHLLLKRMGSYTPIALLALDGTARVLVLALVWGGAVLGVAFRVFWTHAPRFLYVTLYIVLGWCAIPVMGQLFDAGVAAACLTVVGGALYTVGAVVYATKWPDPRPEWFGFHEIFHAFTIAAWISQYVAISLLMYR
jgi:hemolysin III